MKMYVWVCASGNSFSMFSNIKITIEFEEYGSIMEIGTCFSLLTSPHTYAYAISIIMNGKSEWFEMANWKTPLPTSTMTTISILEIILYILYRDRAMICSGKCSLAGEATTEIQANIILCTLHIEITLFKSTSTNVFTSPLPPSPPLVELSIWFSFTHSSVIENF